MASRKNIVTEFTIRPELFYTLLIQPSFAGLFEEYSGIYNGGMEEFFIMPNVAEGIGSPIIDLRPSGAILQPKGGTCKTNWKSMMKSANRKIYVNPAYGAVENCLESFFIEGARDMDPAEMAKQQKALIVQYFRKMIAKDIFTNTYFGDVERAEDSNDQYSWNVFDGVFKKYYNYVSSSGSKPPAPLSIPTGELTPEQAYGILKDLVDSIPSLMTAYGADIMIRVNYKLGKAYMRYLIQSGSGSFKAPDYIQNGIPVLDFEGYPIYVEKRWDDILYNLNGQTVSHCAFLTLKQNCVWGTNSKHGGGPYMDEAFRVWWDTNDQMWKYVFDLTAGTEFIAPQFSALAIADGIF